MSSLIYSAIYATSAKIIIFNQVHIRLPDNHLYPEELLRISVWEKKSERNELKKKKSVLYLSRVLQRVMLQVCRVFDVKQQSIKSTKKKGEPEMTI